jgi:hypothetical protein
MLQEVSTANAIFGTKTSATMCWWGDESPYLCLHLVFMNCTKRMAAGSTVF